jgi:ABC-2 type transport system ATP-binding protein
MDEAEALADRLAVIAGGQIVATGTPDSIGGRAVSEATIRFRLPDGMTPADLPTGMSSAEQTTRSGAIEVTTTDEIDALHRLTSWALDNHVALKGLTVTRLTLEEVYLRLTAPGYTSDEGALSA